jgi:hypothetical protein
VGERENLKEVVASPLEPGREEILPRFGRLPGEQRPWDAVHREPVFVEVEEWRRRIEHHLPLCGAIAEVSEAVCPGIKERDTRSASL